MPKSMFVNVTAEEENRVAIVENGVLDVFEIETLSKEHLKGNIFKVTVEGINPPWKPPSSTTVASAPASSLSTKSISRSTPAATAGPRAKGGGRASAGISRKGWRSWCR